MPKEQVTTNQDSACRREYFRFRYPLSKRPTLTFGGDAFEVTEISEKGLRFYDAQQTPRFDFKRDGHALVEAILTLQSGIRMISGIADRRDGDEIVFIKVAGLSFARMLEEQRRVAKAFLLTKDDNKGG